MDTWHVTAVSISFRKAGLMARFFVYGIRFSFWFWFCVPVLILGGLDPRQRLSAAIWQLDKEGESAI